MKHAVENIHFVATERVPTKCSRALRERGA